MVRMSIDDSDQSYLKDRPLNFLFYVRIVPCFQKEGKLHSVINLYSLILTFQNRKINTHILPLTSKKNIIALHIFYLVYQGEVTVQSFLRRHNCNKKILEEKLDHKHLADLLCHTDFYEVLYLLACGSLHKVDLTKLVSDEFKLPQIIILINIFSFSVSLFFY
uniref:Uncharacterized protein n=1 Tax=Rhizophagus irregularis (strain DAOM 181602 / DAOM 197198 / MUCL 43194) TaxID=747089 RepID=U9U351_RHIID